MALKKLTCLFARHQIENGRCIRCGEVVDPELLKAANAERCAAGQHDLDECRCVFCGIQVHDYNNGICRECGRFEPRYMDHPESDSVFIPASNVFFSEKRLRCKICETETIHLITTEAVLPEKGAGKLPVEGNVISAVCAECGFVFKCKHCGKLSRCNIAPGFFSDTKAYCVRCGGEIEQY